MLAFEEANKTKGKDLLARAMTGKEGSAWGDLHTDLKKKALAHMLQQRGQLGLQDAAVHFRNKMVSGKRDNEVQDAAKVPTHNNAWSAAAPST